MNELREAIRNRLVELTNKYSKDGLYFTALNLSESEVRDEVNRLVTAEYRNLFELRCK